MDSFYLNSNILFRYSVGASFLCLCINAAEKPIFRYCECHFSSINHSENHFEIPIYFPQNPSIAQFVAVSDRQWSKSLSDCVSDNVRWLLWQRTICFGSEVRHKHICGLVRPRSCGSFRTFSQTAELFEFHKAFFQGWIVQTSHLLSPVFFARQNHILNSMGNENQWR